MRLSGKTVGVFVAPEFEDLEFWVPVMRLREEGARVVIIGLSHETVTGKHCLTAAPDIVAGEVRPDALDAVVVPGGWAPDKLRRDADVLRLVRDLHRAGKPVAFICHPGWGAASAGIFGGTPPPRPGCRQRHPQNTGRPPGTTASPPPSQR